MSSYVVPKTVEEIVFAKDKSIEPGAVWDSPLFEVGGFGAVIATCKNDAPHDFKFHLAFDDADGNYGSLDFTQNITGSQYGAIGTDVMKSRIKFRIENGDTLAAHTYSISVRLYPAPRGKTIVGGESV